MTGPQNERAHACSHLSIFDLYPTYHPTGEVQVLQKARNLLSDDLIASLQSAESSLGALNTVDLGPKRPFCVGEFAPWARLTGPQFSAQVEAVVSLVEAPANHCKAAAVKKFLESPFAGKHPKLMRKGTKAAAAEAAVTEAIAVAD